MMYDDEDSLENDDSLKNEDKLKNEATSEMKRTSKMMTYSKLKTTSKMKMTSKKKTASKMKTTSTTSDQHLCREVNKLGLNQSKTVIHELINKVQNPSLYSFFPFAVSKSDLKWLR